MMFLKKLRESRNLSQYGMAKMVGMIANSYRQLENDAKGMQLSTLVRIKRQLGLDWVELGKMIEKEVDEK